MSKLHELLAVESNLRTQAEATRSDLMNTFEKKRTHFTEQIVTFHPYAEGKAPTEENRLSIQTTVRKELDWISEKIAKAMDTAHQIDVANRTAKADVVLDDGTIVLKDVQATSLLQLEKRIKEIHDLVATIPTLDPAKGFGLDMDRGADIFRAHDVTKERTEKQFDWKVMVAATDKHPAQVKELMLDKPVGRILQQEWSSMITVAAKGDMLDRSEALLRAVRKARARANEIDVDVKADKIGDKVLGFVFGK